MFDKSLINGQLFINGKWVKKNLYILGEKIADISDEIKDAKEVIDCSGLKVLPGLIDPHVHFELNCGRVTSVDDFYYGSVAAAYGGVTSIVDFLDPTRNAEELEESYYARIKLAEKSLIDYHMHACIREPNGDLEEYVKMTKKLGMKTIKLFTTYSDTHRRTYDEDIIKLLELSKKYDVLILAHIEADDMISIKPEMTYKDLPISRPGYSETIEALKLAKYAKKTGGFLYMVHCSSGETLRQLKEEYSDIIGKNLFIESCPQYFVFNNSFLEGENGKLFTFAPPLRSERERQLLVHNFDTLLTIGTDHCAFNSEDKNWPTLAGFPLGVGGIEYSFSLMYKRFEEKVIDKMSKNVAMIEDFLTKGELKVGKDADIAVFKDIFNYREQKGHGRCDYSIYEGVLGSGEFIHTLVRGEFVLKDRKIIPHKGKEIICGEK
ncbi:MAG: amidohydrolase family protein [Bacilli bacterium]|nr:amidohydrolase family protein [Bacilli bacterium]